MEKKVPFGAKGLSRRGIQTVSDTYNLVAQAKAAEDHTRCGFSHLRTTMKDYNVPNNHHLNVTVKHNVLANSVYPTLCHSSDGRFQ